MSSKVMCPSFQKTLGVSSRLHGNHIRCPACKAKFLVQIDAMDDLNLNIDDRSTRHNQQKPAADSVESPYERLAASLLTSASSQASSSHAAAPIASPYQVAAQPIQAPSPSYSSWQKTPSTDIDQSSKSKSTDDTDGTDNRRFLQIGVLLMVLGGLSFILPFVGLQLKILNIFGSGAPIIGMILGVLGAVLVVIGYGINEDWTSAFVTGGIPACFLVGFAVVMSQMKPADTGTRNAGPAEFGNNSGRAISQAPSFSSTQFPKGSSPNRKPPASFPNDAQISSRSNVGRPTAAQFAIIDNLGAVARESLSEPTETGFENRPLHRIGESRSGRTLPSTTFGSTTRPDFGSERRSKPNTQSKSFGSESTSKQKSNSNANDWAAKAGNFHDVFSRQAKMEQDFGWSQLRNIPPGMFTKLVGKEETPTRTLVHPNSQPMIGLDFALSPDSGDDLAILIPVYDASEKHQIIAKDGYAIGGLNVYTNGKIFQHHSSVRDRLCSSRSAEAIVRQIGKRIFRV